MKTPKPVLHGRDHKGRDESGKPLGADPAVLYIGATADVGEDQGVRSITSDGNVTSGKVLTADGSGGSSWLAAAAGAASANLPWASVSSNSTSPSQNLIPDGTNRISFFGGLWSTDFANSFNDPSTTCTNADGPLQIKTPGLYLIGVEVVWTDSWGTMNFHLDYEAVNDPFDASGSPIPGFGTWLSGGTNVFASLQAASAGITGGQTSRRLIELLWVDTASAADPLGVIVEARNDSGADRAVKKSLGALYLGATAGT